MIYVIKLLKSLKNLGITSFLLENTKFLSDISKFMCFFNSLVPFLQGAKLVTLGKLGFIGGNLDF